MIATYKSIAGSSLSFGSVKKDASIYYIRPEERIFIQTPCVIARDAFVCSDSNNVIPAATFAVPSRFSSWVRSVEEDIIQYAIDNKAELFAKELEDSFIRSAFRSSVEANLWHLNIHPDVSVFDKSKQLASPKDVAAGMRVVCLFTLNSVRFTKKAFYAKWVLRSVRLSGEPEYQFIDEEDDFTPAHSVIEEDPSDDHEDMNVNEDVDMDVDPADGADKHADNLADSSEIHMPIPSNNSSPDNGVEADAAPLGAEAAVDGEVAHDEDLVDSTDAAVAYQFVAEDESVPACDPAAVPALVAEPADSSEIVVCEPEVTDSAQEAVPENVTDDEVPKDAANALETVEAIEIEIQ